MRAGTGLPAITRTCFTDRRTDDKPIVGSLLQCWTPERPLKFAHAGKDEEQAMAIIRQYNKATGTTYIYDSVSWWVPELKQSRSKRVLIGKLDPVTGDIVPTRKTSRKGEKAQRETAAQLPPPEAQAQTPDEAEEDFPDFDTDSDLTQMEILQAQLMEEMEKNRSLEEKLGDLQKEVTRLTDLNHTLTSLLRQIRQLSSFVSNMDLPPEPESEKGRKKS